jgi:transcriptional regulator with GAF, ATPase, and Fis domain
MSEDRSEASATKSSEPAPRASRGIELVVVERRWLAHHPIPTDRSLSIGRSPDCDIVVSDPAASRRHALVHVAGGLSIEDLDSHNGTRVRGSPLPPRERMPLRVGDAIQIGGATLLVQTSGRTADAPRTGSVVERVTGTDAIGLGNSAMRAVDDLVQRVAPSALTVLVVGETGVGKELVAEAIHRASGARSRRPLVRINCAALPGTLFESELFGHERGAFTGAFAGKPGLLEAADGGTMFLDEIGELSLSAQPKLLRVLEAREVTRVGGLRGRPIDVRFVAATNRDLRAEVARGSFREDLYFRLQGACIAVPPLRERVNDIEPLAHLFVDGFSRELERASPVFSPAAIRCLLRHAWPGNVRELRNAVEWAVLQATGPVIEADHLPSHVVAPDVRPPYPSSSQGESGADTAPPPVWTDAQRAERERIVFALAACHGNQTRAAERLKMPRRTLVAKLAAYKIPRPRARSPEGSCS